MPGSWPEPTLESCKEDTCNQHGECTILDPNTGLQSIECICDIWHTGQRCELPVPIPYAACILNTSVTLLILFFFWYADRRFKTKKTHVYKASYRFVDYLDHSQKAEQQWLKEQHTKEENEIKVITQLHKKGDKDEKALHCYDVRKPVYKPIKVVKIRKSDEDEDDDEVGMLIRDNQMYDDQIASLRARDESTRGTTTGDESTKARTTTTSASRRVTGTGADASTKGIDESTRGANTTQTIPLMNTPSNELVPIDAPLDVFLKAKKQKDMMVKKSLEQRKNAEQKKSAEKKTTPFKKAAKSVKNANKEEKKKRSKG